MTNIIRHARENRKKCSLTPLEGRSDFAFYTYPQCAHSGSLPQFAHSILLDFDGPPLSREDALSCASIVVIDGTWRLASAIRKNVQQLNCCAVRRIPSGFVTAYPRKQTECSEPNEGLASIEAIYIAYCVLGWDVTGLLDNYYWKDSFLQKNDFKQFY